ncbi:MAG: hypothetical protein QMD46_04165 [Methanomicrobiales archaeon]|nr:hypothetical protein [Methanomicrobiales archaeon]
MAALGILGVFAGCVGTSLDDVSYDGRELHVEATNGGGTVDAVLQVNIFQIRDLEQMQIFENASIVTFAQGKNAYSLPVDLDPGRYKLYVYITIGNERTASIIRDIVV